MPMKAKKAYEGKNSLWRRLADTVSIYSFGGTPQEADSLSGNDVGKRFMVARWDTGDIK